MLVAPLKQSRYTRPITSAMFTVEQMVSKIEQILSKEDFDNKMLWRNYYECLKNLRPHLLDENEIDAYDNEVKLTHSCFNKLVDFIRENKNLLTNRNARMLNNVIIEMTRLYTSYGMEYLPLEDTFGNFTEMLKKLPKVMLKEREDGSFLMKADLFSILLKHILDLLINKMD